MHCRSLDIPTPDCQPYPGSLEAFLPSDRDVNSTMFEFKGTAAADASNDRNERDWRIADHYNIQQLGKRPFTTMLLPQTSLHQRSLTEDSRRPSLLQLRSRSSTSIAKQTIYERTDYLPSLLVDRITPRTSRNRRSVSGGSIHRGAGSPDSFGKTLMAKGSKLLRRQNSKHDLTSLQTLEWLEETNRKGHVQETSTRPGSRHSRIQSPGDDPSSRYNISEPFNFQHLTHTTPQHIRKIQGVNHNDLVSEFSAIRASQAPQHELRGIKANDIQQVTSSEKSASETSSPPRTRYSKSPPEGPARDQIHAESHLYSPTSPVRKISHSRSIENFSQPSPGYHTAQSSPTSPPPRTSSRNFAPNFFTFHHESASDPTLGPPIAGQESEPLDRPIATWEDDVFDSSLPHAVTTPDDTAHSIGAPPFSMVRTELAGVPEEDEVSEGKRSSIATSIVRPTTPTSSVRHAKSFPSIKSSPHRRSGVPPQRAEGDHEWLPRQSVKSVSFAAPCVDEHREEIPARPRASRRISLRKEDSWEDVIDYCYEHEAEADCNFDWDVASTHEEPNSLHAEPAGKRIDPTQDGSEPSVSGLVDANASLNYSIMAHRRPSSSYSSSPPLLLPLQTFLPDLQPPIAASAESSFSSIPEAVTPLQFQEPALSTKTSDPNQKGWSAPTNVTPMVLPDESGPESAFDHMYREMLTTHDALEQQLPFHPARVDGSTMSNSPRSSRSPISKSSSQESFWYSQANAAARRHRNAGSVGSLPELIEGKNNEKSDNSSDHLADHVTLLSTNDAPSDGSQRRCSPSLAKDVALKSFLSKVMAPEERDPLPIHPAFRDRANSDATSLSSEYSMVTPPQTKSVGRIRSTSSASSLSSRTGIRASYSLFPSPPTNKS